MFNKVLIAIELRLRCEFVHAGVGRAVSGGLFW